MGKYMRKSKATGEVAVMEVSQAASLGVRTRAKTLALQSSTTAVSSGSYLQLRSRRLEKPPILMRKRLEPRRQKHTPKEPQNPKAGSDGVEGSPVAKSQSQKAEEAEELLAKEEENREKNDLNDNINNENGDLGVEEASFGENVLEFEGRERWVLSGIFFFFVFWFIFVFSFNLLICLFSKKLERLGFSVFCSGGTGNFCSIKALGGLLVLNLFTSF